MKAEFAKPDLRGAIDRRQSVGGQVYRVLKDSIISLVFKPGSELSESSVCDMVGVSRTPVRAAIARLADEGLVDVFPQQGTFVSLIDLQKVYDGHFVRRAVEAAILETVVEKWNPTCSEEAVACIEEQKKCVDSSDFRAFQHHDEAFHQTFARCAKVEGVWGMIRHTKDHLDRVRYLAAPVEGHMELVIAEHQSIVDALNQGKSALALKNMLGHLDKVFSTVEHLSSEYPAFFVPRESE